jgi:hypothetical protein
MTSRPPRWRRRRSTVRARRAGRAAALAGFASDQSRSHGSEA